MSTRVAPSSPPATAKADGEASSGPPADGRYGTQRFFGEESCFAVVVCWPAIPLVVPLLLICGLDTRTVWRATDGTMWEVRARHAQRGDPPLFHVRRVAAASDTRACMHRARGTARLPPPAAPPVSSSLARCSPSRQIVFARHRSPLIVRHTRGVQRHPAGRAGGWRPRGGVWCSRALPSLCPPRPSRSRPTPAPSRSPRVATCPILARAAATRVRVAARGWRPRRAAMRKATGQQRGRRACAWRPPVRRYQRPWSRRERDGRHEGVTQGSGATEC